MSQLIMIETKLQCRFCKTDLTPEQVFDSSGVCWPNQHWISFECLNCHREAKIEIEKTQVSIGDIDGAPGPCFFPDSTVRLRGLKIKWEWWGVEIHYADRMWRVKSKSTKRVATKSNAVDD